jgi:hypothetical protein
LGCLAKAFQKEHYRLRPVNVAEKILQKRNKKKLPNQAKKYQRILIHIEEILFLLVGVEFPLISLSQGERDMPFDSLLFLFARENQICSLIPSYFS